MTLGPRSSTPILSPLRYPGGKRRLRSYLADVLQKNLIRPTLFVEPFAGGASISLELLFADLVDSIALGEKDPMVAGFWETVFNDAEWLIDQISTIEITLENWLRFKSGSFQSTRENALACIFLNRTSFSGIIAKSAGPIGGKSQSSKYPIDCRFPVDKIAQRIRQVSKMADRVKFVNYGDWRDTMEKAHALSPEEIFTYLDPPFYFKSSKLYNETFQHEDHISLHDYLMSYSHPWLLSYDNAKPIAELYSSNGPVSVELLYSITSKSIQGGNTELIITNLENLPAETRLWRTAKERKSTQSLKP